MVSGHDQHLIDADGHDYIDFLGEFTAGIYGHSPKIVNDAIIAALADGVNLSSHNKWEGKLASMIIDRFPSMDLLRFTNSGTEANLMALAAAKAFTGRSKIIVFEGGYHGGVLSFPPGGSKTNVPHEFVLGTYNDQADTQRLIEENKNNLAAILVEPMLGAGGCIPGDPAFLHMLRDMSAAAGALLIFDEIQTSRLSAGGRQALLGITADITTIGKFFGGGLAFGCFGGRLDIMNQFNPSRVDALPHAGTFNNNTLTMAAGCAAVEHLLTPQALVQINERGDRFREDIQALFARLGAPFRVSGLGSIMNIHPISPSMHSADLRNLLFFELVSAGIYIAARGLIALSLSITDEDTATFLAAMEGILIKHKTLFLTT